MLASITPLGERSRRQRWPVTVTALAAGAATTGAAVGAGLAAVGSLLPLGGRARLEVLLAAAAIAAALELLGLRPPTHRRQVDETWLHRYRGWVYGAGFGGQLGVGVWTIVTTFAVYVALLAELLAPRIGAGAAIGGVFGLVRGLTVISTARVDSPMRLAAFHRAFHRGEGVAAVVAVAAEAAVILVVAAVAW
jgi:hypothetical protein